MTTRFRLMTVAALMMCGPSVCFAAPKDDSGDGGGGGGGKSKPAPAEGAVESAAVDPKVAEQADADARELAELRAEKAARDPEIKTLRKDLAERDGELATLREFKAERESADERQAGLDALLDDDSDDDLIGSGLFGDEVAIGNEAVPARHVVRMGHEMSGLSVEDWNALGQTEIDKRLNGVLEAMNAAWRAANGASGAVVFDPLNPGKATLRMAQAVTVHYRERDEKGEEKGPHVPYSLKHGINHDVPTWVAEHEFVRENLDKS